MRVGIGYDIHRFDSRRPLRLGGVTIPLTRGLSGHSDADVLLHALADALLGAVGAPDLGEQFPSRDPRYRNANSRLFVERASRIVRQQGWTIGNVDATVITDAPRLSAYKEPMCRSIGRLLAIHPTQVSVKAKTTEGFTPGKGGIAVHAVVLLKRAQGSGLRAQSTRPRSPAARARSRR